MKRNLIALALVTAGVMASANALAASTTHTLTVNANVLGNCRFNNAGPTTVTVANSGVNIDPSLTGNATGTANVTFRCTTGTVSSVSSDDGQNETGVGAPRLKSGANFMAYTMSFGGSDVQTGIGHGAGGDRTLAVTATIADTVYQNAAAGAYTDSVVLTINP